MKMLETIMNLNLLKSLIHFLSSELGLTCGEVTGNSINPKAALVSQLVITGEHAAEKQHNKAKQ